MAYTQRDRARQKCRQAYIHIQQPVTDETHTGAIIYIGRHTHAYRPKDRLAGRQADTNTYTLHIHMRIHPGGGSH